MSRLYAVMLGGNCAPRSNTELHDVVFVVGEDIESTYPRLLELWFGTPAGLHIDSWLELDVVDGHRVRLTHELVAADRHLYFINLGAYRAGSFAEQHANTFVVADSPEEAKRRAKAQLLQGLDEIHTDDFYEVDEILAVSAVDNWHVVLEPGADAGSGAPQPQNGYRPLPEDLIADFARRRRGD